MPSLPVSRRRALVLAAVALVLLAVAGRTLAGAGAAGSQPAAALVPERAAAAPKLVVHVAGAVRRPGPLPPRRGQASRRRGRPCGRSDRAGRHRRDQPRRAARRRDAGARAAPGRRRSGAARPAAGRVSLELGVARASSTRCRASAGHRAEDRRLPAGARRVPLGRRSRRDPGHRPRADRAAAGARVAVIALVARWPTLLVLARVRRDRARERRARAGGRRSRVVAVGCWRCRGRRRSVAPAACASLRSCSPAGGGASARLDALDRSVLAARVGALGVGRRPSSPARRARRRSRCASPPRCVRFGAARSASASCSSSRRPLAAAGRRPRLARATVDAPRGAGRRLRRARLARAAAASTSSSTAATGGSSAGAAGSAASPTGSARTSRARSPLGSTGSGARCSRGSCSARTRGSPTSCATTSRPPGSTTSWPCRVRTSRSSRSACSALAWLLGIRRLAARSCALAAIAGVRPRGRLAAVRRARRRRGRARSLAWLLGPPARSLALPRARRGRPARLDAGVPARAGLPALVRRRRRDLPAAAAAPARARGLSRAAWLARRARGLDRLRRGDGADPLAPVRRPFPLYSLPANALVAPAIGAAARARARRRR